MRHLFVPACVCLVTWSGAIASEPQLSLEKFTGVTVVNKRAKTRVTQIDPALEADSTASSAAILGSPQASTALPAAETSQVSTMQVSTMQASNDETDVAIVPMPTLSDVPIEIPEQTDIAQTLEPRRIPMPPVAKPVVRRSRQEVCDSLAKAAESNNLPLPFFIRLLFQESGFKPDVVSRAGAEGVAQFMPGTSAEMGLVNPFDPLQAIPASARLLRNLIEQFGNLGLAAAAYNAGPKRIQSWLTKKSKLPEETQGYVKIITGRPAETWKTAAAGTPEMRLPRRAPCQEAAGLYAWNGPARIPMPPSPNGAPVQARAKIKGGGPAVKVAQQAAPAIAHKQTASIKTAVVNMKSGLVQIASHRKSGIVQIAARERVSSIQIAARKKVASAKPDHKAGKGAAKASIKLAMAARSAHK